VASNPSRTILVTGATGNVGRRVVSQLVKDSADVRALTAAGDQQDGQPKGFWAGVEGLTRRTSLEWTFLRPGGFAGNTLMWAAQIRSTGVVRWPYAFR
jgi:nucleoside-diphosphate-sugar epimerase